MIRSNTAWEAERGRADRYTEGAPGGSGDPPLAIVTGASSGIGAAVAERLACRGYRGLLIARRRGPLEALARRCYGPGRCSILSMDLDRCDRIEPHVGPLLRELGPAEVLINNAGSGIYRPFLEHDPQDFERLMRINYHAAVEMIRVVLPGMLRRGKGTIINVASISSKMGPWGHAAYAASKAALVSLTQTLAGEYEGSGVRFCYVNPGIVKTEYFEHEEVCGLWSVVARHALETGPVADKIVRLLDRPRLELCIPRHYRCIDLLKAVSVRLAHRIVTRGSRPRCCDRAPRTAVPDREPAGARFR